jgi:hypothetical protein
MKEYISQITEPRFILQLMVMIIGMSMAWSIMQNKCENNTNKIAALEESFDKRKTIDDERHSQLDVTLLEIKVQLAEIKKDLEYIKRGI